MCTYRVVQPGHPEVMKEELVRVNHPNPTRVTEVPVWSPWNLGGFLHDLPGVFAPTEADATDLEFVEVGDTMYVPMALYRLRKGTWSAKTDSGHDVKSFCWSRFMRTPPGTICTISWIMLDHGTTLHWEYVGIVFFWQKRKRISTTTGQYAVSQPTVPR